MGAVVGALGRGEPGLNGRARTRGLGSKALPFRVVGLHVDIDQSAVPQPLRETLDDGALQGVGIEGLPHRTAAALLHRGALDAQPAVVAVLHAHAAAARRAAEQAGQQMLRPAVVLWPFPASERFHARDALEQVMVDDAQVFGLGAVPIGFGVRTADAPSRVGVLQHADAVPHEDAVVERVRQKATAALSVAVDRHGGPPVATRWRHPLGVELARDGAGRLPRCVVGEDTPDDDGILLDDLELAWPARYGTVAVSAAAGVAPVTDHARHAATRLVGEILEIERAHQPADPDLNLIGDAVVDGLDLDACEGEPLEYAGEVLLIATDAVQSLDHQHVEAALLGGLKHPHDAVAVDERRAGARAVVERSHHRQTVPPRVVLAKRDLVLDGSVALEVRAEPAVDRGAGHRRFCPSVAGRRRGPPDGRGARGRGQGPRRA